MKQIIAASVISLTSVVIAIHPGYALTPQEVYSNCLRDGHSTDQECGRATEAYATKPSAPQAPANTNTRTNTALARRAAALNVCDQKAVGQSWAQQALCSNDAELTYYRVTAFPWMDIVYSWLAARLEVAEQGDKDGASAGVMDLKFRAENSRFFQERSRRIADAKAAASQRKDAQAMIDAGRQELARAQAERERAERELNEVAQRAAQQNQADQDAARRAMQLCIAGRLGAPGDFFTALGNASAACAGSPTYQPPPQSIYVEPSLAPPPTTTTCAPSGGRSFSCTTQ